MVMILVTPNNGNGHFTSLKCYKKSIFKQIQKILNPMAINVRRTSLTRETLHTLHCSARGVIYALIDVLGHYSVTCNNEIFAKLNLPIFVLLVKQVGKSQKYFNLLAFN